MISTLILIHFGRPRLGNTIKPSFNTYQTVDTEMFNFDVLNKDLGLASRLHFVYDFSRKILLVLYSIN